MHKDSEDSCSWDRTKLVKHLRGSLRINLITVSSQQGDEVYDNHTSQNCTPIPKLHFCPGCLAALGSLGFIFPKLSGHSSTHLGAFSLKNQRFISISVPLRFSFCQRTITLHIPELSSRLTKTASCMCPTEFSKGITQCGEVRPSLQ